MPFGSTIQRRTPTLMAGRLRHVIAIVQPLTTQDSTGGFDNQQAVVYAQVWASIEALTGAEKFAAHEFISQVTHQIVIRYIGPAPAWRCKWSYAQGALVLDTNGNLQQAQGPGLSGATAPTWNPTQGGYTEDGNPSTGVTWLNLGVPLPRTGIVAGMLVWFQGRVFQIEGVLNPDERNKVLILTCIEINDSRQQITHQPQGLV